MNHIDLFERGLDDLLAVSPQDVCVIGSGPAGGTIARELSGSGLSVLLLESGGDVRRPSVDTLNEVRSVGRPRQPDQWEVRNRVLGGSSFTWGGRCTPFDEIDFEQRDWVPGSGWPVSLRELEPYLERSASHLGLAVGAGYNSPDFAAVLRASPRLTGMDPGVLLTTFWQFSLDRSPSYPFEYMRFGRHLVHTVADNVTLVSGATVTEITPTPDGRSVRAVTVSTPDGGRAEIRAQVVVVAVGGIENARLLLASDTVVRGGLGNGADLVGRYLMDHPRGDVGRFRIDGSQELQRVLGRYEFDRHLFRAGLRLSPALQRQEGLVNAAAWLGESVAEDDPWVVIRRLLGGGGSLRDMPALARNLPLVASGLDLRGGVGGGARRKLDGLSLVAMVEQVPDPESRIRLDDRRDRFGSRLPLVDWRAHPAEARTVRRLAAKVAEQFGRAGLPTPVLEAWVTDDGDDGLPEEWMDVAHPTGTTRMARGASDGVVGTDLQVHGVDGLFVVGSSVFPTAGHGNPTQMIVALAVRLADHLRVGGLRNAVSVAGESLISPAAHPSAASSSGELVQKVVLTGARGRIGRVVLEDLVARGFHVRAVSTTQQESVAQVDWHLLDLEHATPQEYDGLVEGTVAVVHLAAELGDASKMEAVNVTATKQLAEAAERADVSAFVYTSSVSVYGSSRRRSVDESSRVLSTDRDRPGEYLALPYVREYGRTKLRGELAVQDVVSRTRVVVFRPAVVVDVPDLVSIGEWPASKRLFGAHRHSHHVYVRDVSNALLWAIDRAREASTEPGSTEVFVIGEDDSPRPTHAAFMRRALRQTGDPRFRVPSIPGVFDLMHDWMRFRRVVIGRPLWAMRFSTKKLERAGWHRPYGMAYAERVALSEMRRVYAAPSRRRGLDQ